MQGKKTYNKHIPKKKFVPPKNLKLYNLNLINKNRQPIEDFDIKIKKNSKNQKMYSACILHLHHNLKFNDDDDLFLMMGRPIIFLDLLKMK